LEFVEGKKLPAIEILQKRVGWYGIIKFKH
jgi:hypothetical protein